MAKKPRRIQEVEINFKPKVMQEKIIKMLERSDCRLLFVCMARQCGKSTVARYLMLKWTAKPNITLAYITPTFRLSKEIFNKMLQTLPKEMVLRANSQELEIVLSNTSRIIFMSAESIENYRGLTLDYLICDEVHFYKEYTSNGNHWYWNVISPMLDVRGKKQLFISTPNGKQGFFWEGFERGMRWQKGWCSILAPITSDETRTAEWIEEKKKMYPPLRWQQEYMCEFLEGAASYFKNFSKLFTEEEYDFSTSQWVGIDWSSVGEDDTVVSFINENNQMIQYKVEGDLDAKYTQIASIINQHYQKVEWIVMEKNSIGNVMGNEVLKLLHPNLKRKIEYFNTTNSSKNEVIDMLALDIDKEEIHFMRENSELLQQLETFSYEITANGKHKFGALQGCHDDFVLSACFANYGKHKMKKKDRAYIAIIKR